MTSSVDKRILNLSYSSLLELHSCPRKFQLYKLSATPDTLESAESSLTFTFGQVVGLGIQLAFQEFTEDEIIWQMFLNWKVDLFFENKKQNKNFWQAVSAVQQFIKMRESGFLEDWELVYYEGKPAVELSFVINFPGGFRYRGFVDAVLKHKVTGQVRVLEAKTSSSSNLNPAQYKNSAQAIGYSIVLDRIFKGLSAYGVLYLVYTTKDKAYTTLPFSKSLLQRALWIQEILLDIEAINRYEQVGVYPMHGESCFNFYHECPYMQTCTLSTSFLTKPLTQEEEILLEEKEASYQIEVNVKELIEAQIERST